MQSTMIFWESETGSELQVTWSQKDTFPNFQKDIYIYISPAPVTTMWLQKDMLKFPSQKFHPKGLELLGAGLS